MKPPHDDYRQAKAETKEKLARKRARATPVEQATVEGKPPLFHDMLIIGPVGDGRKTQLFRVPVIKVPAQTSGKGAKKKDKSGKQAEVAGTYVDKPEALDLYDYAHRRTLTVARPNEWGTANAAPRGPAFGTLPVKREPAATHCFACYLVSSENLSFRNAWTAEEWNDIASVDLPPHPSADDDKLQVLLAGPRGKVFLLELKLEHPEGKDDPWPMGKQLTIGEGGFIENLNLRHEVEIWNQLRNGLVAGRVFCRRLARPEGSPVSTDGLVPIVNVTSLMGDDPAVAALINEASASEGRSE